MAANDMALPFGFLYLASDEYWKQDSELWCKKTRSSNLKFRSLNFEPCLHSSALHDFDGLQPASLLSCTVLLRLMKLHALLLTCPARENWEDGGEER